MDVVTDFVGSFSESLSELSLLDVVKYSVTGFILILTYYIYYVARKWQGDFSGERLGRTAKACPSNSGRPDVARFSVTQSTIVANSELHNAFAKCELIADVKVKQKNWRENAIVRERAKPTPFLGIDGSKKAEELNMDHVYITLIDFIWGFFFIGPNSFYLWLKGTAILRLRIWAIKMGWYKMPPCEDMEGLIATFCLEQTQVINYFARTKKGSELGNIAGFFFANFPYVDMDLQYQVADLFAVDIDLDTKKFVKAKLDDEELTASDTLILLWFNTIAAQHVKLHAMANWGVNTHSSIADINPFLYRNSVVTTIYNYFGYTSFSTFLDGWEKQGLLSKGWTETNALIKCFNHGIKDGIGQHGNIIDLVPHSRFVNFVVKVRMVFMDQFAKYKDEFPGIDGEAFFVGTILHSLDHTLMDWNLPDPLWLDVDNPKFGKMAEMGRIVRVGFVQDVPGLYFNKRFKGATHPFYKAVYEKAAKIDKELADNMDTCIIK